MKINSVIKFLMLFLLIPTLYKCAPPAGTPPGIEITPKPIVKIFKEGINNYCYFTIKNSSTSEPCEIALESPTKNKFLTLVSALPFLTKNTLNPLQTVEVKYQITWNSATPCPGGTATPCIVDKIGIMARWPSNHEEHDEIPVQWSNPVVQSDCYFGDGGRTDDHYRGLLCDHPSTNNNTVPGSLFKNVGDIYNPNDFEIEVLVQNSLPHAQVCIGQEDHKVDPTHWAKIASHTYYPYGDKIRANFGGFSGACNQANPASIQIYSTTTILPPAGGEKWIALKVIYQ